MNEYATIARDYQTEQHMRRADQVKGLVKQMLDQWDERRKPVLTYQEYSAFLQVAYFLREVSEAA